MQTYLVELAQNSAVQNLKSFMEILIVKTMGSENVLFFVGRFNTDCTVQGSHLDFVGKIISREKERHFNV